MKIAYLAPLLLLTACRFGQPPEPETDADIVSLTEPAATRSRYETVTRVVDGDTFVIAAHWSPYDLEWRIRLLGIDTPEKGYLAKCQRERDLAARAKALSEKLLDQSGNRVRLQGVKHDKYGGRLDATVVLADGSTLQQQLINAKLAKPYNGDGPKPSWCF